MFGNESVSDQLKQQNDLADTPSQKLERICEGCGEPATRKANLSIDVHWFDLATDDCYDGDTLVDLREIYFCDDCDVDSNTLKHEQKLPDLLAELDTPNESVPDGEPRNETRYGYPLPPDDFASLPLEEIRRWGKMAIDARISVDVESSDGQVDTGWVIDALGWSGWVLDLVVKAIGRNDPVLLAYGNTVNVERTYWQKEGF